MSVPSIGLVGGKFADEDPFAGTPGSLIPAQWGNAVTDEIRNAIIAAGLIPDEMVNNQLASAIRLIIGTASRNVRCSVPTAAASATFTADELVLKAGLGGMAYTLYSFNKTVSLASVGVGGMDVGAPPISAFVSIYAIYNPTTQTAALLACNQATSSGSVYSGANMPAGYTASALVSAWGTTAAGLLAVGLQLDRQIDIAQALIVSSTVNQTATPTSIASIVPIATKKVSGLMQVGSSASANCTISLSGSPSGIGSKNVGASVIGGNVVQGPFTDVLVGTTQTIYYTANAQSGALSSVAYVTSYSI